MAHVANIYEGIPAKKAEESFETLLQQGALRLERIVSKGHATPAGEWYDQESHEWVLLLAGSAALLLEGEATPILLKPGDHLHLPAHCRHRVEWTDPERETIWLALHYHSQE